MHRQLGDNQCDNHSTFLAKNNEGQSPVPSRKLCFCGLKKPWTKTYCEDFIDLLAPIKIGFNFFHSSLLTEKA